MSDPPAEYLTTTGNGFSTFPKLSNENYLVWSSNMKSLLKGLNQYVMVLGEVACPTDPAGRGAWDLRSDRAYMEISMRVEDAWKQPIAMTEDPILAWEALEEEYGGGKTDSLRTLYLGKLQQATYDPTTPIQDHATAMKDLRLKLKAAGHELKENEFRIHFLNSLPEQFDTFVMSVTKDEKLADIVTRLRGLELRREMRGETPGNAAAFAAQGARAGGHGGSGPRTRGTTQRSGTCRKCGQEGHWERDRAQCPMQNGGGGSGSGGHRKTQNSRRGGGGGRRNTAGAQQQTASKPTGRMFASVEEFPDTSLVAEECVGCEYTMHLVDSGASDYWIPQREDLHNYRELDKPIEISAANGTVFAKGVGDLHYAAIGPDGEEVFGVLKDAKWVPSARVRMLSTGRLAEDGYKISITSSGLDLTGPSGEHTIHLPVRHRVYPWLLRIIPPTTAPQASAAAAVVLSDSELAGKLDAGEIALAASRGLAFDWMAFHRAMGHLNIVACQQLARNGASATRMEDVNAPLPHHHDCAACIAGKATRRPHPEGRERAKGILDMVHMDIFGPTETAAHDGSRFGLVLCDDKGRVGTVEGLLKKSGALAAFKKWKAAVELSTGRKIRTIMCDNAKEFIEGQFKRYCEQLGIRILSSVPYNPQSNGIAERKIRAVTEGATAMITDAQLSPRFWLLACQAKMYLLNRSPTRANDGKTPYEVFYGEKPNLTHIKPFGCHVNVVVPDERRRGKFAGKIWSGIFVGYLAWEGGYLVYDPVRRKVFPAESIIWHENSLGPAVPAGGPRAEENVEVVKAIESAPQPEEVPAPEEPAPQVEEEPLKIRIPAAAVRQVVENRHQQQNQSNLVNTVYDYPRGALRGGGSRGAGGATGGAAIDFAMSSMLSELDFALATAAPPMGDDPRTVREALSGPDADEWREAIAAENANLVSHDVYEWADPGGAPVMGSTTVLRTKYNAQGEISSRKARFCAQGFTQIPGEHYDPFQKPASVVRFETLRIIASVAVTFPNVVARQFDVKSAYLHRPLREVIYMRPPPGMEHLTDRGKAWRLKKPLYGTVQGGAYWEEERDEFLDGLGWQKIHADPSVFVQSWTEEKVIVVFWVDDETGWGTEQRLLELEDQFNAKYGISGAGPLTWTLGISFTRDLDASTIALSQKLYIEQLVRRFRQEQAQVVSTPFAPGTVLTADMSPATDAEKRDMLGVPYRELVGSLLYAMVVTRPDIAYPVGVLCKFMANPGRAHWNAAVRVLRYLKGTADIPLVLGGNRTLRAYSDADYAGDRDDRRSTGAYVFTIGVGAVSWVSKKQDVVALSTLEAELMALTQAAKEAVWIKRLLNELGARLDQITILGDNQGALAVCRTTTFHSRSKHIDIQYYFVREKVAEGVIALEYISTRAMVADALTKALPLDKFLGFCAEMGIFLRA